LEPADSVFVADEALDAAAVPVGVAENDMGEMARVAVLLLNHTPSKSKSGT
jgi:hypothetical protein